MNSSHPPSAPIAPSCGLAAHAACDIAGPAIDGLRRSPGPRCGEPLPTSTLKHADEQTLAVLEAVGRAVTAGGFDPASGVFRDWGVLVAPRFVGRITVGPSVQRYRAEGAWGVSPHLIPHRSLHSVSGTVSQALRSHGPNFGVGGGPGHIAEGLLAGLTLLHTRRLPGLWLVFSRLDPEQAAADAFRTDPAATFQAVALALVPDGTTSPYRLQLTCATSAATEAAFELPDLRALLAGAATGVRASVGRHVQVDIRPTPTPAVPVTGPHAFMGRSATSWREQS